MNQEELVTEIIHILSSEDVNKHNSQSEKKVDCSFGYCDIDYRINKWIIYYINSWTDFESNNG